MVLLMKELPNIYDAKGEPIFIELDQRDRDAIRAMQQGERMKMISDNTFKIIKEHAPWYEGEIEMADVAIDIALLHMEELYGEEE